MLPPLGYASSPPRQAACKQEAPFPLHIVTHYPLGTCLNGFSADPQGESSESSLQGEEASFCFSARPPSGSCNAACCFSFSPPWLVWPLPPLSQSFLNSSCNLTKRAFLSEKSSPLPSLNVDQHLSQLHGVRLVNRLLPGPISTPLPKWEQVARSCFRCPHSAELWSPGPMLTSKDPDVLGRLGGSVGEASDS